MYTPSTLHAPMTDTVAAAQLPSRRDWMAAWALLVLCTAAMVMAAVALVRAHEPRPAPTVAPASAAPTYTPGQVAAATVKTCTAWWSASSAMDDASNAVNESPGPAGWSNPARQQARDRETDITLAQTAYLKSQVDQATPAQLRHLLDQYNELSFAELDATVHHLGDQVDALFKQQNAVMADIDAQCRK